MAVPTLSAVKLAWQTVNNGSLNTFILRDYLLYLIYVNSYNSTPTIARFGYSWINGADQATVAVNFDNLMQTLVAQRLHSVVPYTDNTGVSGILVIYYEE